MSTVVRKSSFFRPFLSFSNWNRPRFRKFEMLDDQVNEGKNAHRANPVDETDSEAKTDQSHSEQDKAQREHSC